MIATITAVSENRVDARVRRNHRSEPVSRIPQVVNLKVGLRIEVVRQTNNPYLIFKRIAE